MIQLEDFYPSPEKLIKHELAALNYLRSQPYMKEEHSRFARDAADYFNKNAGSLVNRSKRAGARFEFFSWLDVAHGGKKSNHKAVPNIRLVTSALIQTNGKAYEHVSYCLAVCRTSSFAVMRKFHFDVAVTSPSSNSRRQPHPRCHLQYCGEMIPEMEKMGIRPTQLVPLYPSLSEPRILSWPMSLALLLDMTLHEFPDAKSEKFRAEPGWRAIVREHEQVLIRPFFESCLKSIRYRGREGPTLADALYVA